MIQPAETVAKDSNEQQPNPAMIALARYGLVPQVAKFGISEEQLSEFGEQLKRGALVVVETERGAELADVLEILNPGVAVFH